jgi:hypothetical protein
MYKQGTLPEVTPEIRGIIISIPVQLLEIQILEYFPIPKPIGLCFLVEAVGVPRVSRVRQEYRV